MDFGVIVFVAVAFTVLVAGMIYWINRQQATQGREDSRVAWTALAARRDLALVEGPNGGFHLKGAVDGVDYTLMQVPVAYGSLGILIKAGVPHHGEPEWVVFAGEERPTPLAGPAVRVATGDEAFDPAYKVCIERGETPPARLTEPVRAALLKIPSAQLHYCFGSFSLMWPREDLDLEDEVLDAALVIVRELARPAPAAPPAN